MKRASCLFAPVVKPQLPPCEADRVNTYHNDEPGKTYQCSFSARYVVDGKKLCSKHAGVAALNILLGEANA